SVPSGRQILTLTMSARRSPSSSATEAGTGGRAGMRSPRTTCGAISRPMSASAVRRAPPIACCVSASESAAPSATAPMARMVAVAGYGKTTLLAEALELLGDRAVTVLDAGREWIDVAEAERMLATPGAVLVGRRLPRVSLARARAAGTLLEIRAAELAFDARE